MTNTSPHSVSFYFSAHQDDWQLFMNPSAFREVMDRNTKCVFIHMTAGDAGLGAKDGGRKHPYFLARENGAECAICFMTDSDDQRPIEKAEETATLGGHHIRRVKYRNTVAYFLRIPDGSSGGNGYAGTGYESLTRLAGGRIDKLSTIDGTTTYQGWQDLVETLRALIEFERTGATSVRLHVPEIDPAINPNDHADHVMTARAALDATQNMTGICRLYHVGYAGAELPENLSAYERDLKCSVYAVTTAGVLAFGHPIAWQHYDRAFVGRSYFRAEKENQDLSSQADLV
jgi:LmbE family N-acetylglucosaminyl deacetylase